MTENPLDDLGFLYKVFNSAYASTVKQPVLELLRTLTEETPLKVVLAVLEKVNREIAQRMKDMEVRQQEIKEAQAKIDKKIQELKTALKTKINDPELSGVLRPALLNLAQLQQEFLQIVEEAKQYPLQVKSETVLKKAQAVLAQLEEIKKLEAEKQALEAGIGLSPA